MIFHEYDGNCEVLYIVELLAPCVGVNATVNKTSVCLSRHAVVHRLLAAINNNNNNINDNALVENRSILETEQNTTFVEDTPLTITPNVMVTDSTFNDGAVDNVALGDWFSRPVHIATYVWNEGAFLDEVLLPWYEFFNILTIRNKLFGYSRLRCNLHAKFMINASPFQSGLVIASYKPLVSFTGSTDYSGGNIDTVKASRNGQLMGYSQRMHVDLFPQTNEGGVLSMPFVHHQNWLNLSGSRLSFVEELKKMGRINLTSVSALNNCSGTAGSHANISVYVWATDVQLSGPAYEVQSDEYSDRPVSFSLGCGRNVWCTCACTCHRTIRVGYQHCFSCHSINSKNFWIFQRAHIV